MGQPRPLFVYFVFFKQLFTEKAVRLSRIWTRIVEAEGEHANNFTTTMAQPPIFV